ncbi:MAG: hypothetical protein H5U12_29905, partial [Hoeflea sp.]|nr:hypothetical protein [Hoeflea sp.]
MVPSPSRALPFAALLLCSAAPAWAQGVSIVQPGAPGQPVQVLTQEQAIALTRNDFS